MSSSDVPRTPNGRFAPGGPGRPRGAVNKLAARVRQAILRDFEMHHQNILEQMRLENPAAYMRTVTQAFGHAGADYEPQDDEPLKSDPTKEWLLGKARLACKIADEKATYAEVETFCAWKKPEEGHEGPLTPPWDVGLEAAAEAMKMGDVENLGPQSLKELRARDAAIEAEQEAEAEEAGGGAEADGAEAGGAEAGGEPAAEGGGAPPARVSNAEDEFEWIERRFKQLDERKEKERLAREKWESEAEWRKMRGR